MIIKSFSKSDDDIISLEMIIESFSKNDNVIISLGIIMVNHFH